MQKTLGGDRLGSGKKQKIHLHNYERSTHDMGYIWRSTMASGTLVPFLCEVGLPGDTFDISLDCDIKTHPTVGPLFGSYKVQLDVFQAPIRLYHSALHNNALNVGMNMAAIKLPQIYLRYGDESNANPDISNSQINPSCLLSYLGIRGIANLQSTPPVPDVYRTMNGIPMLAYWEIYKNYYANKQEGIGAVIHNIAGTVTKTITSVTVLGLYNVVIAEYPNIGANATITPGQVVNWKIAINYTGTIPDLNEIAYVNSSGGQVPILWYFENQGASTPGTIVLDYKNVPNMPTITIANWVYNGNGVSVATEPKVSTFPLENIDTMREKILASGKNAQFIVNVPGSPITPYSWLLDWATVGGLDYSNYTKTQEGLAIKTYQSDLFNNWLKTEWIDGPNGIADITAIDTTAGSFTLDTLNLSKKVYNLLNRIAVSGGSYDDYIEATYAHEQYTRAESPIYEGGLIKELVFQEVVSNSNTADQPLGTLAGKGTMAKKHKGGKIHVKVNEPSYIMGIISLTPRVDYSQGNKWDTALDNMNDFHKPALDEIGFQELITEQMAWWSTTSNGAVLTTKSAGKQPAWINYMTNVNQTRGNFAIESNEMFMTLNRRYEYDDVTKGIKDLTTYIDPSKFNFIFATTALDSQNFWAQIAIDMTARRKMSAKVMPNL